MVKFNIFIALLSLIAGIANIVVGLNTSEYSNMDLFLAIIQVCLALSVGITGFSRLSLFIKNDVLSLAHRYCAIVFYLFIAVVVWFLA